MYGIVFQHLSLKRLSLIIPIEHLLENARDAHKSVICFLFRYTHTHIHTHTRSMSERRAAADHAELLKQLKAKSSKYFKCLICQNNQIKEQTHFRSRRSAQQVHSKQRLTEDERNKWIQMRIKEELKKSPDVYRLSFGRFQGCTIQQVMEKSPGYFASFVQQTSPGNQPYHDKPDLREQLIKAKLWNGIISQSKDKKQSRSTYARGSQLAAPEDDTTGRA